MEIASMQNITKSFGLTRALDSVTITVNKGEVLSLLGENGAGKTTLMNILCGLYRKDGGTILLKGNEVEFSSPQESIAARIGMIHQSFTLVSEFTALENVLLGLSNTPSLINKKKITEEVSVTSRRFQLGLERKLDTPVYKLSVGEQQKVEILKCLVKNPELIILDEPDRLLTEGERQDFFNWLEQLTNQGHTIVLITHNVNTAIMVSTRIAVLEKGKLKATIQAKETSRDELIALMFAEFSPSIHKQGRTQTSGRLLDVTSLKVRDDMGFESVSDVSLHVDQEEIVGIAGIEGNGQSEIAEAVMNLRKKVAGSIKFNGEEISSYPTKQIQKMGITLFGSKNMLIQPLSVKINSVLDSPEDSAFSTHGNLNWQTIAQHARRIVDKYDVRCSGIDAPASALSGGNKQKLVMGRKLEQTPKLLLVVNATKDLDLKSTEYLYGMLLEYRKKGGTVLFISVDLDAIIDISDRVYVINRGKIVGEFSDLTSETKQSIGKLMAEVS